eukprot:403375507
MDNEDSDNKKHFFSNQRDTKVEFTYKGHKRYKTLLGAFFTLIQKTAMFVFIAYQFYLLFTRKHPITHRKIKIQDLDNISPFDPRTKGFELAFKLMDQSSDQDAIINSNVQYFQEPLAEQITINYSNNNQISSVIDTSYGNIVAYQIVQIPSGLSYQLKYNYLNIIKCDRSQFSKISDQEWSSYDLSSHYCIDPASQYQLYGDLTSNYQSKLQIAIKPCQNQLLKNGTTITCKSTEEIRTYFESKRFKMTYINTNFDFQVYDENTLQYFLDDSYEFQLDSKKSQNIKIKVQQAITQQYDNFFTFWEYDTVGYYEILPIDYQENKVDITQNSSTIAQITVQMNKRTLKYVRQVEHLFDVVESIGGFKESLHSIVFIMIVFFQERLFKGAFLKQLYLHKISKMPKILRSQSLHQKNENNNSNVTQQSPDINDKTLKIESKFGNRVLQKMKAVKNMTAFQQRLAKMNSFNLKTNIQSEINVIEELATKEKLEDFQITKLINEILKRRRFHYGYKLVLDYLCKLACCRNLDKLKKDIGYRPHHLFNKGNEKLEQELDIVNLLKSIRQLRLLSKILLPQRNRLLLKFSKQTVIDSGSSSSDSDYHKNDVMKQLDNKNNFIKLSAAVKIKKTLDYYKTNKMDENDKILLKGIFIKKAKDFHDELQRTPMLPKRFSMMLVHNMDASDSDESEESQSQRNPADSKRPLNGYKMSKFSGNMKRLQQQKQEEDQSFDTLNPHNHEKPSVSDVNDSEHFSDKEDGSNRSIDNRGNTTAKKLMHRRSSRATQDQQSGKDKSLIGMEDDFSNISKAPSLNKYQKRNKNHNTNQNKVQFFPYSPRDVILQQSKNDYTSMFGGKQGSHHQSSQQQKYGSNQNHTIVINAAKQVNFVTPDRFINGNNQGNSSPNFRNDNVDSSIQNIDFHQRNKIYSRDKKDDKTRIVSKKRTKLVDLEQPDQQFQGSDYSESN